MMLQVTVDSVRASLMSPQRLVVLRTTEGDRYLPIWIGGFEADAIAIELQGLDTPRPMSHDLLRSAITALGGKVSHVVIRDLQQDTFFASVVLDQDGQELQLDARPSDSVALAVRAKAPIFVDSSVLDRAGVVEEVDLREEARARSQHHDETLEVFREFIEELSFDQGTGTQSADEEVA